jgi:MFS family permease
MKKRNLLKSKKILPLIMISQFLCTSLWFAGNGVSDDIIHSFQLAPEAVGYLTSFVQFGFVLGTLGFALLSIADKFSPSKIFFVCALFGSLFNLGILVESNNLFSIVTFRFLTGISLAGIYPIGMKIAADYFDKGLGKSLGWLVGALVVGTAFPHFLKLISGNYSWEYVIVATSLLATLGGLLIIVFVPQGPYCKVNSKTNIKDLIRVFKKENFSQAAMGYFGHMWELYAFWTFTPTILATYNKLNLDINLSIPLYSFVIIGSGCLACILGGYLSSYFGLKKTATCFLILSGLCCLISPFIFSSSPILFVSFLVFWGLVVIADSPLFSTLVATNTEPETKGTALTIVNSIGFSITIISIQLLNYLQGITESSFIFLLLAIGPIIGVRSLITKKTA